MGGSIRKEIVSKVTHLIANSCGSEKYRYAITFRVPIMSVGWVHNAWAMRTQVGFNAQLHNTVLHSNAITLNCITVKFSDILNAV